MKLYYLKCEAENTINLVFMKFNEVDLQVKSLISLI